MAIKDKFTLVVPTNNRYSYLERLLSFYEECAFPFPVLVLDGSSDTDITPKLRQLLNNERVKHRKFPVELYSGKRLALGLMEVETEFCAFGADDDFLIPKGIEECVAFLEANPDYSIAQGLSIQHTIKKDRLGRPHFFWGPLYERQASVASDDPEDRLRCVWNGFNGAIFYAVFRTPLSRLICAEIADRKTNYCLAEILALALGLMYSKVKILPVFYCSREISTYVWLNNTLKLEVYSPEACAPVIDCWTSHLSKLKSMDFAVARKLVKNNFDPYVLRVLEGAREAVPPRGNKEVGGKGDVRSGFASKLLRHLVWRWNKFRYWCVFKISFESDFDRVSRTVIAANIDPELLSRTRKSYSKNCKA